jgi:5-methylcytosine-specific restriction endonuclease McrA
MPRLRQAQEEAKHDVLLTIGTDKMEAAKHKPKRGDVREDGMIFWKNTTWLTADKFEQYRKLHAESVKRYTDRNKEKRKIYFDKWYSENKQVHRAIGKSWANKNKETVKKIQKRYYEKNKSKILKTSKEWNKKNPEKYRLLKRTIEGRRRARINQNSKNLTKNQNKIIKCFYEQAQRMESRLGIKFHVDHIVPIALGGMHTPTNLQVLPASLNVKKHAREVYRWSELQLN